MELSATGHIPLLSIQKQCYSCIPSSDIHSSDYYMEGYHIPSLEEWNILRDSLEDGVGIGLSAGGKLKSG